MKRAISDSVILADLEYLVEKYGDSLAAAVKAVEQAEKGRDQWASRLESVKAILEHEKERIGKQLPLDRHSPYAGLTLKQAVLRVINDRRGEPVTFTEIIEKLSANGYLIQSQYPTRSLHAALIGASEVEKVDRATYRWRDHPETLDWMPRTNQ